MTLSNLGICYEALQRNYRNAVVQHVRDCLKTAYSTDYADKLKAPFAKEWEKISASAAERRNTGEITSEIKDDFDILSVNHFFNLFETHYDALCVSPITLMPEQKKQEKNTLLQWLNFIKNLRDPLSHPSEQDFTFEDSFVLLDSARRVLVKVGLKEAANAVKDWASQLVGRPLYVEGRAEILEDRLPPRESVVSEFVGRRLELEELWKWLIQPVGAGHCREKAVRGP